MKEIIQISLGGFGTNLALTFWEQLVKEHNLGDQSTLQAHEGNPNIYFHETQKVLLPRAVFVDTSSQSYDKVFSKSRVHFNPDNLIYGNLAQTNNFAAAITQGQPLFDIASEAIRAEVEKCDSLQGIQVFHSLSGGTGSGFLSLLLQNLEENLRSECLQFSTLLPSKCNEITLSPYNATLALSKQLYQDNCMLAMYDNMATYALALKSSKLDKVSHEDLNALISQSLSGLTSTFRFSSKFNDSLQKIILNLSPFSRTTSVIPSITTNEFFGSQDYCSYSSKELIQAVLSQDQCLSSANLSEGINLASTINFRGNIHFSELNKMLSKLAGCKKAFVEWIPDSIIVGHVAKTYETNKPQAAMFSHSTSAQQVYKRIAEEFVALFRKRSYLHHYTQNGIEEQTLTEGESNLNDYVSNYQIGCDCCGGEEEY